MIDSCNEQIVTSCDDGIIHFDDEIRDMMMTKIWRKEDQQKRRRSSFHATFSR